MNQVFQQLNEYARERAECERAEQRGQVGEVQFEKARDDGDGNLKVLQNDRDGGQNADDGNHSGVDSFLCIHHIPP